MAETAQGIDPLSGITTRILAAAMGVICLATAVFLVASNPREYSSVPLQVAAGFTLLVTYVFFVWAAEPYRRRVTGWRYLLVFALVLLACTLDSLSQLDVNESTRDDWGPIVVALTLMLSATYRPPREILAYTAAAVVAIALLTGLHAETLPGGYLSAAIIEATAPSLALGSGAAVYASYLIAGLRRSRQRAADEKNRRDAVDRREAIEEFLGRDVEPLRRDVLPFLRAVKAQDAVTEADTQHSAALALSLRGLLDHNLHPEPFSGAVGHFDDPESLSPTLTGTQRAALRALLVFLASQPGVEHTDLSLVFAAQPTARARIDAPAPADRAFVLSAQPFIGLAQLAFAGVETVQAGERITVTVGLDTNAVTGSPRTP